MKKTKKTKTTELFYRAIKGDCVELMRQRYAVLSTGPKLIIADPPYNQGAIYDAYGDLKPYDEYMQFTQNWLKAAKFALSPHGSMWVFAPDEWVSEIDGFVKHTLKMYKRRHVIWAFTFGQASQKNFSKSHCHLLYFTNTKTKYTFNADSLRVPSARQAVYNDNRANSKGKLPDATWMLLREQLEPEMQPDRDTWMVSRVCGTFGERQPHSPNQIPIPVMERIVLACSNPGDLVVEPFAGSGSAGVACAMHGRSWEGFDISKKCIMRSQQRVEAVLEC